MASANEIDAKMAKLFFGEIRRTFEDEETRRASFRGDMGALKQRREDIYERAESSGVPKKLLKARIKQWIEDKRIAEAKARREAVVPDDIDDRAKFQQLCEALGDFKDLPLGQAAVDAAAPAGGSQGDDDADIRPRHLREQEADRIARENAEKITKGIKPLRVVGLPGADAVEA
ncbi:MAG TPA: hypothetical protein VIG36_08045 [Methylocystis sp.]|jgi:Fe-S oxidoreductase